MIPDFSLIIFLPLLFNRSHSLFFSVALPLSTFRSVLLFILILLSRFLSPSLPSGSNFSFLCSTTPPPPHSNFLLSALSFFVFEFVNLPFYLKVFSSSPTANVDDNLLSQILSVQDILFFHVDLAYFAFGDSVLYLLIFSSFLQSFTLPLALFPSFVSYNLIISLIALS